ncbi:MAG: hypothetical protein K5798_03795 [Nitrosopumilus sp.]|uniref:hypothetical protein n=1 Tax=Nitrosopumilus sp. TaxID=2024843 RepID=UPI00242E6FE9|nr:hypothetical protein [Nitrosopumilus sp.]MCV0366375.1 hypothetical protein [Nitrosopumilus sp.]
MTLCKEICSRFESISRHSAYHTGGCYCKICDYYFKEKYLRCPCCNMRVRYSTRSNRRKTESEIARI